jgi:hypothetical protein
MRLTPTKSSSSRRRASVGKCEDTAQDPAPMTPNRNLLT